MSSFTLADLEAIVALRATSEDENSYTRKLVMKGMGRAAKKLGEEAVETALAAVAGSKDELRSETADLLYHLLVVLHIGGVSLDDVMAELAARTGRSGLEEKAARPKD
ncbi:MAG: phosphoribosyl-ATP diphosphatase [Ancalomicrobiaceae bacterium]|nr:phosphoribosyl-ATP diphosphatase [Ancalomicrobiaceae bacterium]